MYKRRSYLSPRRSGYRSQRSGRKASKCLKAIMWILTALCIILVCAATASRAKATQVIAAESEPVSGSAQDGGGEIADIVRAIADSQRLIVQTETERIERIMEEQKALEEQAAAEADRAIVIDPGHGGIDGGCMFDDVPEKEINLEIARAVAERLEKMGYTVILTRTEDTYVDKAERVRNANSRNARLYVSIHQNSCGVKSVEGIETWYDENDGTGESRRLAQSIQQETVGSTGAVERKLVPDSELCVLKMSNMPSCLIETGFLSNKEERARLCTGAYQERIAEGIAQGIDQYLSGAV